MRRYRLPLYVLFVALATAGNLSAQQTLPTIRIGGFGGAWYGKTTDYRYLGGAANGNFNNTNLAVLISSAVSDKLSVSTLLQWNQQGSEQQVTLGYAFATWRLKRAFDFRFGKVKHPGSLYSEVIDVGTVRPFLSLPQAVYADACLGIDHYTGAGVNGHVFAGDWDLGIAAYGGGGSCRYRSARTALGEAITGLTISSTVVYRAVIGGRITVRPPIPGLTFGGGLLRGAANPASGQESRGTQLAGQVEYLTSKLWFRAEIMHSRGESVDASPQAGRGRFRSTGYYAEAAYFVTPGWQVAGQVGRLQDRLLDTPAAPPDLDRHREVAIGLNRWLTTNLVIKASYHWVSGNRLVFPEGGELLQAVGAGLLSPRSRLFQAGAQFSF